MSQKYFLEYLPKQKTFKATEKNERYIRVCKCLNDEIKTLAQIAFIIDVSSPYTKFLTLFQGEGPLIQVLFNEMKDLLKTIM